MHPRIAFLLLPLANFTTDVVHLNNCLIDTGCVPACFRDCSCKYPDGTECSETTPFPTPMPTPKPPTPSPVPKVCAKKVNDNLCPTVALDTNLQAGQSCDYCYNFCNGKFLSCCEENGTCGVKECEADEETGVKEEIFGCPEIFVTPGTGDNKSPSPGVSPPSRGASIFLSSDWAHSPVLVAVVTLLFLMRG